MKRALREPHRYRGDVVRAGADAQLHGADRDCPSRSGPHHRHHPILSIWLPIRWLSLRHISRHQRCGEVRTITRRQDL